MNNLQLKINKYVKQQQNNIRLTENDDYDLKFAYTDESEHIVSIYKNETLILRAKYEILGCYNLISSIWIWAWSINQVERNLVENPKKDIKKFANSLFNNIITKDIEEYLYYAFNDTFFISYKSLDKLLKFGLYATKSKYVIAYKTDENKPKTIEFILIKKVIQEHHI
jgi:hypothetical protein